MTSRAPRPTALLFAATAMAASLVQGCCCCWVPFGAPDQGDDPVGSPLVSLVDAFVLVAVALACYSRQERKHRPVWVSRWTAKRGIGGGAYRAPDLAVDESVKAPPAVRAVGGLAFVGVAVSLAALAGLAHPLRRAWTAFQLEMRASTSFNLFACAALAALTVALAAGTTFAGNAVLARKADVRRTRLLGKTLVVVHLVLITVALLRWGSLVDDVAALLNQPPAPPPLFGPSLVTTLAASAVVLWPALGVATGIAFLRASPSLARAE